jgi:hypothetical protein
MEITGVAPEKIDIKLDFFAPFVSEPPNPAT